MNKRELWTACCLGAILMSLLGIGYLGKWEVKIKDRMPIYEELCRLEEEMTAEEAQMRKTQESLEQEMLQLEEYDRRLASVKEKMAEMEGLGEQDRFLYDLSIGRLYTAYDVTMFQGSQKTSEAAGTLGKIFGGLLGSAMSANLEENRNLIYENRTEFVKTLTQSVEESFYEAIQAKVHFDGCFGVYEQMTASETEEELLRWEVLSDTWKADAWEEEKLALLDSLETYAFDLSLAKLFYNCILSSGELRYQEELGRQLREIQAVLEQYPADGPRGYTEEEKLSRYEELLGRYIPTLEYMSGSTIDDKGLQSMGEKTAKNISFFRGYGNQNRLVYAKESKSYMFVDIEQRFYDTKGNPLYLKLKEGTVTLMDGEIIRHSCADDQMAERLVEEARWIWDHYTSQEFEREYQNIKV